MAFLYTWDAAFKGDPADVEDAKLGAGRIRALKVALSERLEIDHKLDGNADDGKHVKVTLVEQTTKPTLITNECAVYSKDVSGITKLFIEDSAAEEFKVQVAPIDTLRANVAMHASTMNLFLDRRIIDGTGSAVVIIAIANAPIIGDEALLYPITGTTITHGAIFDVQGNINYVTEAGDALRFRSVTVSTFKVDIIKDSGTPIVNPVLPVSKNLVINGGFTINQRAYVSGVALASGSYGHDRFKAGSSGGDYTFAQLASSTQITIAASKTLIQVIEDKNVQDSSYVLSWTGTAKARYAVNSATPAGAYASSPILITGQTPGSTMSIEFGNGASSGTLKDVQLERGAVVGLTERRSFQDELMMCYRYYQDYGNAYMRYDTGIARTLNIVFKWITPMRVAPTVAGSSVGGSPSNTITPVDILISGTSTTTGLIGYTGVTATAEL